MARVRYQWFGGVNPSRVGMRAARAVVHGFVRAHRPRCVICGTRLLPGDPLSLCGGHVAHAECALIHWLAREQVDEPDSRLRGSIRPDVRRELERLGLGDGDASLPG